MAFDQQSQRYLNYKRPSYMVPGSLPDAPPRCVTASRLEMDDSLAFYGEMLEAGIPGEDARFVMPNATRTNLIMTANLRALIHMSGLRLCTMAQWEIRRLFQLIRHEVFCVSPFLGSFLAPEMRARWATATRIAIGTSTARSGRTKTTCWPRGPRRKPPPKAAGRELPTI